MDLLFITRGKVSPQGKPKVYFSCHPDDFEKYFPEITDELLSRQDCAIFYLKPDMMPDNMNEHELNLLEMNLFVVPVTSRLLKIENRAMDTEIPYALKKHIPILPIMKESVDIDIFNKKFGDLQYLDKYNIDPTAISYEEKMTRYLESIFTSHKLIERIKAAFDAYIFLSYRKKDRKYAQELMHIIHENPICRDIAIWYDEFLVPGENFNNAIQKALEKCDIFALTITPNVINEINYIIEHEYPMAVKMGKKIFPAEIIDTDHHKLNKLYQNIPKTVKTQDKENFQTSLIKILQEISVSEQKNDPKHNFFIGLAYLSGIDLEVNHERAVELISGSAEKGYIPAIEKLVAMYQNGEGVERNAEKAISYQQKLAEILKQKNISEPSIQNANEYTKSCTDLIQMYKNAGKVEFLKHCEEYVNYYNEFESFAELYPDSEEERYIFYMAMVDAKIIIGELFETAKQYEDADKYYQEAHRIALMGLFNALFSPFLSDNKSKYNNNKELLDNNLSERQAVVERKIVNIYLSAANLNRIMENMEKAQENDLLAIKEAEKLSEKTKTVFDRQLLSLCYARHGYTLRNLEMYDDAEKMFLMSLQINSELSEKTRESRFFADMAFDYYDMAKLDIYRDKDNSAIQKLQKAFELLKIHIDRTDTLKYRKLYVLVCNKLGKYHLDRNDINKSEQYYNIANEMTDKVSGKDDIFYIMKDTIYGLGNICLKKDDIDGFEHYYYIIIKLLEVKLEQEVNEGYQEELADCNYEVGISLLEKNSYKKAKMYLLRAYMVYSKCNDIKKTIKNCLRMYLCMRKSADISFKQANYDLAKNSYLVAVSHIEQLTELDNNVENQLDLANTYFSLSNVYFKENDYSSATKYLEKSDEIYQQVRKELTDIHNVLLHALCLDILTQCYQKLQSLDNARSVSIRAVELWTMLYENDSSNEVTTPMYANACLIAGILNINKIYLDKAEEIALKYLEIEPEAVNCRQIAEEATQQKKILFNIDEPANSSKDNEKRKKKSFFDFFNKKKK